jgi:hypothetical protein
MSKLASIVTKTAPLLEPLGSEKLLELSRQLDITFEEHFVWQTKQSELNASGKISLEDAMFLYEQLGGSASVFNQRPVAVKYVVSQFMLVVLTPKS